MELWEIISGANLAGLIICFGLEDSVDVNDKNDISVKFEHQVEFCPFESVHVIPIRSIDSDAVFSGACGLP